MKRTELEKFQAKKIEGRMGREAIPVRYAQGAGAPATKREQRKRDQAAGLVPFAVKLPQPLVTALQERAAKRGIALGEVVSELLAEALRAPQD